jgi:hypothetical protein
VVSSSLTSVGTLSSLTVSGNATLSGAGSALTLAGSTRNGAFRVTGSTLEFRDATGGANLATLNLGTGAFSALYDMSVSGDLTVDTSTLKVDSTNNRVGIGTASPSTTLDVQSPEGRINLTSTTGINASYHTIVNTGGSFYIGRDSSGGGLSGAAYAAALVSTGAYPMVFSTNSTERMRLDASGNVGLGVTPSAWSSLFKVAQIAAQSAFWGSSTATYISTNNYNDGGDKYIGTGNATRYYQLNGQHVWQTAASGTAGTAITFTQAMTLDASGNFGVGTTSPIGTTVAAGSITAAGVLVAQSYLSSNQTNSAVIEYNTNVMRLRAYGATAGTGILAFNTGGGGGSGDTERARITSGGDFLHGTTDSGLTTGVGYKSIYSATNPYTGIVITGSTNTETNWHLYSTGAAAYRFYVGGAGTVFATNTTISAISDARLKENVRDLDVGLDAILALRPRTFDWKEGKGSDVKDVRGFIAQEFEEVFPDLIDEWKDPAPEGEEPYKSVRQDLIPVLVKAIQELNAKNASLEARLAALES